MLIARNFLAGLRESQMGNAVLKRDSGRIPTLRTEGTRHFHVMGDDSCGGARITKTFIRRDPLVAALFGEEPARARGGP
jgi:hypothetical protein